LLSEQNLNYHLKDLKRYGIVDQDTTSRYTITWLGNILLSAYEQVPPRQLDEIRLDEVMSRSLVTVGEETDLRACAKVMLAKGISSLVVIDGKKNLKGIVTKTDVAKALAAHG
jgi:CBS domain-containing protein